MRDMSNAQKAFFEAAQARADAIAARFPHRPLVAVCVAWEQSEGISDDVADEALTLLKADLPNDEPTWETFREFRTGLYTPQTEAVEHAITLTPLRLAMAAKHARHSPVADRIMVIMADIDAPASAARIAA